MRSIEKSNENTPLMVLVGSHPVSRDFSTQFFFLPAFNFGAEGIVLTDLSLNTSIGVFGTGIYYVYQCKESR
jgi:hypothetical protein